MNTAKDYPADHMTRAYTDDGFLVDTNVKILDSGRAMSTKRYLKFADDSQSIWLPLETCRPDIVEAVQRLKAADILVSGDENRRDLKRAIETINSFPQVNLIEHTGHYDGCFGYPDGSTFCPGIRSPEIAYESNLVCTDERGTLQEWKEHVIDLLAGQHIPLFSVLMALAAPLLALSGIQGNYLVNYSGPPRRGKSTSIALAASLCGPSMDSPNGSRYMLRFNNTMNRVEELMPRYRDLPMIIDELSSFGTRTSRMNEIRTLVHHIAGVDGKGRWGDSRKAGSHVRTIVQLTANETGGELLGLESEDAAEAVLDRLIDIPVPRGEEGVYNEPYPDFADSKAFAAEVSNRLGRYYGTAMPVFIQELVKAQSEAGSEFGAQIQQRIADFKALPAVTRFGDVSSRVLDLFGLAYAAGRFARYHEILPPSVDPAATVVRCLGLHLGQRVKIDPVQRVLGWISANRVIDLRSPPLPAMSSIRLRRRGAFIAESHSGPQFWIHPALFRASFNEPLSLMRRLHARGLLEADGRGEKRHFARKRKVLRNAPPQRVLVFNLPDFEEWLEQNGMEKPRKRRR